MQLEFSYTQNDLRQALEWRPYRGLGRVSLRRALTGWIIFVVIALVLFVLLRHGQPGPVRPPMPQPGELRQWVVALVPALLIVFGIWFLFVRRIRIRDVSTKLWESSPVFQLPHTIQVDENGIRVNCALIETLYRWPYFVGFGETTDLLLLLLPNHSRVMIPKRAISGDDALNQLREFVQTHVHTLTGGFPVGIKAPLPLSGAGT